MFVFKTSGSRSSSSSSLIPSTSHSLLSNISLELKHRIMVRRSLKTRAMLLLISLLLMAIVSHGRRVAEQDVVAFGDSGGGGLPPAYLSKQASSSASRRHLREDYKRMHVVSKRLVPQGPNPLHNWLDLWSSEAEIGLHLQRDTQSFCIQPYGVICEVVAAVSWTDVK